MNSAEYNKTAQDFAERNQRIEDLETVLKEIIADAMDNPTSIPAKVTWTSIHKAQRLLED